MVVSKPNPCFLDQCIPLGYIYGEKRWRSQCSAYLYTWDALHGEIEVFSPRGRHRGVIHAVTGVQIKLAVKGRTINV